MRKTFNYFILLLSNILILSFLSIWNIANAGNVVVYTASGPEIFEPIADGFKSNNPDIDLSFIVLDTGEMFQRLKEFPQKTYAELERYRNEDRQQEAQQIPLSESQQSQAELEPIEKGVCVVGEARKDRQEMNPKIKALEEALANALAVNESHQKLNGKLQERLTELEEENKKIHDHLNKRIESARKSGL